MAKGFDCATPLTAALAAKFKDDGFEFVCRYLVPSGWKRLTKDEAEAISDAGLQIVSVFETTANRALGGQANGLMDGEIAAQVAKAIGQHPGSTIYFAVDFNATTEQILTVIDYIKAASEATPEYETGVYGSYAVINAVRDAGACSHFWQTRAWSRGNVADDINIYQHDCGPQGLGLTMNGISVDLDESFGGEGWWNTMPQYFLSVDTANEIIDLHLKPIYEFSESEVDRKKAHTQANELRRASGQPEE